MPKEDPGGQFCAIGVPEDGLSQFDIATFRAHPGAGWPEARVEIDPVTQPPPFTLPMIPLWASLDSTSPGGLRWRAAQISAWQREGPARR